MNDPVITRIFAEHRAACARIDGEFLFGAVAFMLLGLLLFFVIIYGEATLVMLAVRP